MHIVKQSHVNNKYVVNQLCNTLREKEMFPALLFVFSRKQVEEFANDITTPLFDENEKDYKVAPVCKQLLVSRVPNWKEYIMLPEYETYVKLLEKGIGLHHAGMIPIFREMMEILYEQKYIKVLVATETFSIGLNMPTKTVCFTSLHKHDGHSYRMLYNNEFKQMCGRAGRRNIDKIGYVVLLTNMFKPIEPSEYMDLLSTKENHIKSKFKINYSLVFHQPRDEAIDYVKKSLMYTDIQRSIEHSKHRIQALEQASPIDEALVCRCAEYEVLVKQLEFATHKKRKELQKKMKDYSDIVDYNETIKANQQTIYNELQHKQYAETYVENKLDNLYRILEENHFMTNHIITEKGTMACMMNEIHKLVFCDVYVETNGFSEYTPTSLFSLLSCFYELKSESIHPPADDNISFIKQRMNYYEDQELGIMDQYDLQYVMYDYIRRWMEQCNDENACLQFINEFKSEFFLGDFVKCCLKLIHISDEISSICEYVDNYELLDKIKEGKQKITKFIMSNQSLYL